VVHPEKGIYAITLTNLNTRISSFYWHIVKSITKLYHFSDFFLIYGNRQVFGIILRNISQINLTPISAGIGGVEYANLPNYIGNRRN